MIEGKSVYVLIIFCSFGFIQNAIFTTFSIKPDCSKETLHFSDDTLDLLLNWHGIVYCVCILPYLWFASKDSTSFSLLLRTGCVLSCLGAFVRMIPLFFTCPPSLHSCKDSSMTWLIHLGQILNALAGLFSNSLQTTIGAAFFPPRSRPMVTALVVIAIGNGMAIYYSLGVYFFPSCSNRHMEGLLLNQLCVIFVTTILSIIYIPRVIYDSELDMVRRDSNSLVFVEDSWSIQERWSQLRPNLKPFFILGLAWAIVSGVQNAWAQILPDILSHKLDSSQSGIFTSCFGWGGVAGALIMSSVISLKVFRSRKVFWITFCFGMQTICVTLFSLSFRSVAWYHPPLSLRYIHLCIIMTCTGFFNVGATPLCFELAKEITHPLPPAISNGLMVFGLQIFMLITLFLPYDHLEYSLNLVMAISCGFATTGLTFLSTITYKRPEPAALLSSSHLE